MTFSASMQGGGSPVDELPCDVPLEPPLLELLDVSIPLVELPSPELDELTADVLPVLECPADSDPDPLADELEEDEDEAPDVEPDVELVDARLVDELCPSP